MNNYNNINVYKKDFYFHIEINRPKQLNALNQATIKEIGSCLNAFEKNNKGLIIAEIELNNEDEAFETPPWVGKEITSDYRYLNSNLAIKPFNKR